MRKRCGTRDSPPSPQIDDIVREHDIDAGFEWVDGYLHAPLGDDASDQPEHLKADATARG